MLPCLSPCNGADYGQGLQSPQSGWLCRAVQGGATLEVHPTCSALNTSAGCAIVCKHRGTPADLFFAAPCFRTLRTYGSVPFTMQRCRLLPRSAKPAERVAVQGCAGGATLEVHPTLEVHRTAGLCVCRILGCAPRCVLWVTRHVCSAVLVHGRCRQGAVRS